MTEAELYQQYINETKQDPVQKTSEAELYQQYLAETSPPKGREAQAFAQGFGNAASFGYLPQIQAATEPLIQSVMDKFLPSDPVGFDVQTPKQDYTQRRDQYIREGQQLAEENPYSSMAGGVAGSVTSGIATGGALGKALGVTGRAATFAGRAKQAATTGAAIGAIRNPGDTEGELSPIQPIERLKNAATDAATGLVVQGGLEGLGKAGSIIKDSGKNLKTYAELKSLKASGAMLKDFRKAFGKGKATTLGREVLDEGIVGIGDDITDIAQKAEKSVSESSARLNAVYDEADKVLAESIGPVNFQVNLKNVTDKLKVTLKTKYANSLDGDEIIANLEKELEKVASKKDITFGELRKLRQSIDEKINHSKLKQDLPAFQEELSNLRNLIQDEVKEKLGSINPELKQSFIRENKKLSNLIEISKMAKDKAAREESNQAFGLSEKLAAGAGGVIGSIVGGPVGTGIGLVAAPAIAKASRQYGTPFVAITANKIAKALESNPNIMGVFSTPLIKAAQASPKEFVSSVNILLKKPEFKQAIESLKLQEINSMPALGDERPPISRSPSQKFTRKNK